MARMSSTRCSALICPMTTSLMRLSSASTCAVRTRIVACTLLLSSSSRCGACGLPRRRLGIGVARRRRRPSCVLAAAVGCRTRTRLRRPPASAGGLGVAALLGIAASRRVLRPRRGGSARRRASAVAGRGESELACSAVEVERVVLVLARVVGQEDDRVERLEEESLISGV